MRALSEIGAMVHKAALGAGLPLGQAEDLGRVAIYLAGTGGDVDVISAALKDHTAPQVVWEDQKLRVTAGAPGLVAPIIVDAFAMGITRAELAGATQAGLVRAFLAAAGYDVIIDGKAVSLNAKMPPDTPVGPVAIAESIWTGWAAFAAKTYVPASAASRLAGAGAGLTDTD